MVILISRFWPEETWLLLRRIAPKHNGTTRLLEAALWLEKKHQDVASTNEPDETGMAETIAPSGRLAGAAENETEAKARNTANTEKGGQLAALRGELAKIETIVGRLETAALGMQQRQRQAVAESHGIGTMAGQETGAVMIEAAIEPTAEIRETERSVRRNSGGNIGMTEAVRGEATKPTGPC